MTEKELAELRTRIDEIDKAMADLFVKRMIVSGDIAVYKMRSGLSILDASREEEKLRTQEALVPEVLKPYYREFLLECMELSKAYQKEVQKEL